MTERRTAEQKAAEPSSTQSLADYQQPKDYGRLAYVTVPIDTLRAAVHAFRSYQFGNASPALGEACADQLEGILTKAGVKL